MIKKFSNCELKPCFREAKGYCDICDIQVCNNCSQGHELTCKEPEKHVCPVVECDKEHKEDKSDDKDKKEDKKDKK